MPDESIQRAPAREVVRTGKMPSRPDPTASSNVMARPRPEKKREPGAAADPKILRWSFRSATGSPTRPASGKSSPAVQAQRAKDGTRARPENRPARQLGDTKLGRVKRISVSARPPRRSSADFDSTKGHAARRALPPHLDCDGPAAFFHNSAINHQAPRPPAHSAVGYVGLAGERVAGSADRQFLTRREPGCVPGAHATADSKAGVRTGALRRRAGRTDSCRLENRGPRPVADKPVEESAHDAGMFSTGVGSSRPRASFADAAQVGYVVHLDDARHRGRIPQRACRLPGEALGSRGRQLSVLPARRRSAPVRTPAFESAVA